MGFGEDGAVRTVERSCWGVGKGNVSVSLGGQWCKEKWVFKIVGQGGVGQSGVEDEVQGVLDVEREVEGELEDDSEVGQGGVEDEVGQSGVEEGREGPGRVVHAGLCLTLVRVRGAIFPSIMMRECVEGRGDQEWFIRPARWL